MLVLRVWFITLLPDPDVDSYGRFNIARALLDKPEDLRVLWVWLPGWQVALCGMIRAGMSFFQVRLLNAALQSAGPILLFSLLRSRERAASREARTQTPDPRGSIGRNTALVASLMYSIAPLSNLLATSAQSETLFTVLLLGVVWSLDRRGSGLRGFLAGLLLSAATLIRYEAWPVVLALAAAWALRGTPIARRLRLDRLGVRGATVLLPAFAIGAWISLRYLADGRWFAFLFETHDFASGLRRATDADVPGRLLLDLLWYPCIVPLKVLGPAALLVLLARGERADRLLSPAARLVPVALVASLAVSYAARATLGLDRHFAAVVPFAAIAMALGADRLAEQRPRCRRVRIAALALASLAMMMCVHAAWFVWRTTKLWQARMAASAWIDEHGKEGLIFCDDSTLELTTHLPASRFRRSPVAAITRAEIDEAARRGPVFIYTWASRLGASSEVGELAGRWVGDPGGPEREAIVIRAIRARADPGP